MGSTLGLLKAPPGYDPTCLKLSPRLVGEIYWPFSTRRMVLIAKGCTRCLMIGGVKSTGDSIGVLMAGTARYVERKAHVLSKLSGRTLVCIIQSRSYAERRLNFARLDLISILLQAIKQDHMPILEPDLDLPRTQTRDLF